MEEEQFFVPDYGEDLQTEGEEGDESLTDGVEIVGEYVVVDESLPDEVEIVGEYVVLDKLPMEELLVVDQVGETDEMPPMLFRDNRVVVRRSKDRLKLVRLLRCRTCRTRTTHLKKHVLRHHVCRRWWFLYPTKACWSCKRHEIALHARHHGTFLPEARAFIFTEGGPVLYLAVQGATHQVSNTVVHIDSP